jgi:hypothetical protein
MRRPLRPESAVTRAQPNYAPAGRYPILVLEQTFKSREILDEVNALLEKIAMNAARDTASSRIRTGKATPSDLKYAFRPTDDVARNGADGGGLAACAELLCRRKGTPSPNVASSPPPSRFGHSAAD